MTMMQRKTGLYWVILKAKERLRDLEKELTPEKEDSYLSPQMRARNGMEYI